MKRNLQFPKLNSNTFFKSVLVIAAILISAFTSYATTDTIPATLQSPTKFGGCIDTIFTLTYNSHHHHVLKIQTSLQNADSNCATSSGKPQLFIKVDSSSISLANFKTDTLTGKLYCNVDTANQTVYIRYKVFIDCSILNPTSDSTSISKNLLQQFSDTTGYYYFNINSNGNIATYTGIISPKIISNISNSTQTYFSNYLEKNYITFIYTNYNLDAHIKFRFYPGDTTLCGHGKTLSYEYKTDTMSNYVAFNPATNVAGFIPANGFLFIRQMVTDTNCWEQNDTCNSTATLQWQCNLPIPDTLFCSACLNNVETDYTIQSNDAPKVVLKTLSPLTNASNDYNCFNDTVNMTSWSYLIVHDSLSYGAADTVEVFLRLHNGGISNTNLTIIPKSSISIYKSNSLTSIDTTFYHSATAPLCQNYINDSIYAMSFLFNQFKHGDTIIVNFKTFKCAEENDVALLNKPKQLNQWEVYARAYSICKSWQPYYGGAISYENYGGAANIHQQLDFSPSTNNLSVPHDSIFGDSLLLQVRLKGLQVTNYPAYNSIQFLGCQSYDSTSSCPPNGLIRARINVGTGLHISHPDSLVYFLIDTGVNPVYIFADYYNTSVIPFDTCMSGSYYFYFPITKQLLYALNYGNFECVVQACCGMPMNDEPVAAQIAFHLMPDPIDSCNNISFPFSANHIDPPSYGNVNAAYIPLSATGAQIHVHCPGCKAPGLIADRYSIRRINLGLQDSDNDGIADFPEKQIGSDSTWYAQNKKHLETNTSSYGDRLQDFLVAHFQDGSDMTMNSSAGGYTYAMMKAKGAFLKYIQVAILIPDTESSFGLTPTGFDFYIDEHNNISPDCRDCDIFSVDTNYRTKLHIHVPQSSLAQFMIQDSSSFFYSFSTVNTSPFYLLDSTFIIHRDTVSPFSTFEVDQRYRMTVSYDECKYFEAGIYPTIETAKRTCEITVRNWLSGTAQSAYAFDNGFNMPNDTIELDSAGWTFNQSYHPLDSLVTQQFANNFIFYCEFNGTIHNFYSQDMYFSAAYESTYIDCNMNLRVRTTSATAGALPQLHTYPYEFRPPSLFPKSYNLFIQPGYTPINATINNRVWVNGQCYGFLCPSKQVTIPFPTAINNYMLFDSLPDAKCFNESNVSGLSNDTNAYMQNDLTVREFTILLAPDSCTSFINVGSDSAFISTGGFPNLSCIQFATCNDSIIFKNEPAYQNINESKPNLIVSFTPINNTVTKHRLSWRLKIENPNITVDSIGGLPFSTTVATNVYLQAPALAFLSNWTFKNDDSTNTNIPYSGNLFKLRNYLSVGYQINGTISCDYSPCADSAIVEFITGYNCDSFPTAPLDTNNVCQAILNAVKFNDAVSQISSGNVPDISFGLCKDFECAVNFSLSNQGDIFADSILISGLATGMNVVSVAIKNCDNDSIVPLTSNSNNHWYITLNKMHDVGFSDSLLVDTTNQNCLQVIATLNADCSFNSGFSNNNIIFFGHNFCGSVLSDTIQGFNFNYNDSNFCTQCFTIAKTVDKATTIVGDTVTYTVTVCSNNGSTQQVYITDTLLVPANFHVTSSTIPGYIYNFPKDTCINYLLKGYFLTSDSCPHTTNTGILQKSNNDKIYSSVCNTIYPECYTAGMIFLPDSTLSSTLSSTSNKTYYVIKTFIIDTNTTFTNCTIYVASGGNIVVWTGDSLTLDTTSIMGCGSMWKGIKLDTIARMLMKKTSIVRDANKGISLSEKSNLYVYDSRIIDCVTGIFIDSTSDCSNHNIVCKVEGTKFGLTRSVFLPNYSGQPSHGTLPKAGIDMSDMIVNTIGNNSSARNVFDKLNIGLIAYRSRMQLHNSVFKNISIDTLYSEDYRGTAVISIGQKSLCAKAGTIEIYRGVNNDSLIKDCYRGVYSRYSNLYIGRNKLINVTVGVYSSVCTDLLSTNIDSCRIEASLKGINWIYNAGASLMWAHNDTIIMSGDTTAMAIKLTETNTTGLPNYVIENNNITLNAGKAGIDVNSVLQPFIALNKINQLTSGSLHPATDGISLDGCDSAQVSCNSIYTNYTNTISGSYGIKVSQSPNNIIQCNTTTNQNRGVFFGGANCIGTTFRGDSMVTNSVGLYLNNTAVIDTQTHAGNRWIGTFASGFGAKNLNDGSLTILRQSLFIVVPGISTYTPAIPTSDNGWFKPDTGTTFSCASTNCENQFLTYDGSEELQMSIAEGSSITSDFIPESNAIASQYLYEDFKQDSTKFVGNSTLETFVSVNENTAIGHLYEAKKSLQASGELHDTIKTELMASYNSLKIYSDSISYIDNLSVSNPNVGYVNIRAQLINQINLLNANISSLLFTNKTKIDTQLNYAGINNSLVTPLEVPEENDKFVNQIEIIFKMYGIDSVASYYQQILEIANQCPYKGGKSVYRARSFIAVFNDNIWYDDDNVCEQQGYYRASNEIPLSINNIQVIPNPANEKVEVILNGNYSGLCGIKLKNSIGMEVLTAQFDCSEKQHTFSVKTLSVGVYILQLNVNNENVANTKLVIVR